MKAIVDKLLFFVFFLFGALNVFAQPVPPVPLPPPPPPGLPINEPVFYLLIIAVFFGIYIIYSRKMQNKTSI